MMIYNLKTVTYSQIFIKDIQHSMLKEKQLSKTLPTCATLIRIKTRQQNAMSNAFVISAHRSDKFYK